GRRGRPVWICLAGGRTLGDAPLPPGTAHLADADDARPGRSLGGAGVDPSDVVYRISVARPGSQPVAATAGSAGRGLHRGLGRLVHADPLQPRARVLPADVSGNAA